MGGDGGVEGFSGTLGPAALKAVFECIRDTLVSGSVIMDAGHGLGQPFYLLHHWLPTVEVRQA